MKNARRKMTVICAASAALGRGGFACAVKKDELFFAFLGFATLYPFVGGVREVCKLARADGL